MDKEPTYKEAFAELAVPANECPDVKPNKSAPESSEFFYENGYGVIVYHLVRDGIITDITVRVPCQEEAMAVDICFVSADLIRDLGKQLAEDVASAPEIKELIKINKKGE